MNDFKINGEFITISQLLKVLDYISSGGESKFFLLGNQVLLNDVKVTERKKKIRPGDWVVINNKRFKML